MLDLYAHAFHIHKAAHFPGRVSRKRAEIPLQIPRQEIKFDRKSKLLYPPECTINRAERQNWRKL
jgi:hypothetical protein